MTSDVAILMQRGQSNDEAAMQAIVELEGSSQSDPDVREEIIDATNRLQSGRIKDTGEPTEAIVSRVMGGQGEAVSPTGNADPNAVSPNIAGGEPQDVPTNQPVGREVKLMNLIARQAQEIRDLEGQIGKANSQGAVA